MPENPIAAAGRCRPAPAALFISAAVRRLAPYRPSASYLSANTSTAPSIQPSSSPPASTHHEHERRRLANIRPPKQQCWTAAAAAAAGLGDASHRHSSSRTNATSTTTSVQSAAATTAYNGQLSSPCRVHDFVVFHYELVVSQQQ